MESDRNHDIEELLWLKAIHSSGIKADTARLDHLEKRYPERLDSPEALEEIGVRKQIVAVLRPAVEAVVSDRDQSEREDRERELNLWKEQGAQLLSQMRELKEESQKELADVRRRVKSVRAWERRRVLAILLSILLSIGLAIGLFHWVFRMYANNPTSQLMVTYDIGTLAQSLLVGIAALIAAFTYASRRSASDNQQ